MHEMVAMRITKEAKSGMWLLPRKRSISTRAPLLSLVVINTTSLLSRLVCALPGYRKRKLTGCSPKVTIS